MKNSILIVALLMFGLTIQAQKLTKKFLIGKWTSETVELEFSKSITNEFSVAAFSSLTGNNFLIEGYQFNNNNFYLKMLHEQNNWGSIAKFIVIDENTMVADYVSKSPGQMIYKRVLNNK